MGINVLLSASGSPGVTAAAVGVTLTSPRRALLVEADTSRTSDLLAGYFRGSRSPEHGMDGVAALVAVGKLNETTIQREMTALNESGSASVITGFGELGATRGASSIWGEFALTLASLAQLGWDINIDAGRWSLDDPRIPLLSVADRVLLVTRPQLPALFAARNLLSQLRTLPQLPDAADRVGIVIREATPQSWPDRQVEALLGHAIAGHLNDDPATAAIFTLGTPASSRSNKKTLVRSYARLGAEARQRADRQVREMSEAAEALEELA